MRDGVPNVPRCRLDIFLNADGSHETSVRSIQPDIAVSRHGGLKGCSLDTISNNRGDRTLGPPRVHGKIHYINTRRRNSRSL